MKCTAIARLIFMPTTAHTSIERDDFLPANSCFKIAGTFQEMTDLFIYLELIPNDSYFP